MGEGVVGLMPPWDAPSCILLPLNLFAQFDPASEISHELSTVIQLQRRVSTSEMRTLSAQIVQIPVSP
jgi:hypothetical protein